MRYLTFILVILFTYGSAFSAVELDADSNSAIDLDKGGTNATTAAGARTNLGIGNIDNTSDANKPVSSATQAALDLKIDYVEQATAPANLNALWRDTDQGNVLKAHNGTTWTVLGEGGSSLVAGTDYLTPDAIAAAYQTALGFTPENASNKGVANGYAGLGSDGLVPSSQLPPSVGTDDRTAAEVVVTPWDSYTGTNVQALVQEMDTALRGLVGGGFDSAGNYSPTGTWDWSGVNGATVWPTFNQNTTGNANTATLAATATTALGVSGNPSFTANEITATKLIYDEAVSTAADGTRIAGLTDNTTLPGTDVRTDIPDGYASFEHKPYWRSNLSAFERALLASDTDIFQAHDADLDTYAGITPSANVQSILSAANYAAIQALLNVEPDTFSVVTSQTTGTITFDPAASETVDYSISGTGTWTLAFTAPPTGEKRTIVIDLIAVGTDVTLVFPGTGFGKRQADAIPTTVTAGETLSLVCDVYSNATEKCAVIGGAAY